MTKNEKLLNLSVGARAAINVIHDELSPRQLQKVESTIEQLIVDLKKFDIILRTILQGGK